MVPETELVRGEGGGPSFFAPRGSFWKVNRENVLMLGAGCALLLQLAHPLVAQGVADHSDFLERPLKRLYRTMRAMQDILCGTREKALVAARRLRTVHRRIQGTLKNETEVFPEGTRYEANDPELLLWVHGTLIHAALVTYEELFSPLPDAERREYYEESKRLARLFGVPVDVIPEDFPAFSRYLDRMVRGSVLAVTPTARRLAGAVLDPPIAFVPELMWRWNRLITTALLPPILRERYGLPWNEEHQRSWRAFRSYARSALPYVPDILRAAPCATWAELRWTVSRLRN